MNQKTTSQPDDLDTRSTKAAEATVYSLNNPYLNEQQKLQVEMWYQLPFELSTLAFLVSCVLYVLQDLSWLHLLAIPIGTDLISGIYLWFFYNRKVVLLAYATLANKMFQWIAVLAVVAFLVWTGEYLLAAAVVGVKIGFSLLFGAHMILFGVQAQQKYRMHPKYAFFKKYYGITFPFEI
jgi:hypothetical protein